MEVEEGLRMSAVGAGKGASWRWGGDGGKESRRVWEGKGGKEGIHLKRQRQSVNGWEKVHYDACPIQDVLDESYMPQFIS